MGHLISVKTSPKTLEKIPFYRYGGCVDYNCWVVGNKQCIKAI